MEYYKSSVAQTKVERRPKFSFHKSMAPEAIRGIFLPHVR